MSKKIDIDLKFTKNLNCFSKSPYKWYRFRQHWRHYTQCIKYAWQRAVRGYSDRDIWGFSDWHTDLMRAALRHFRDNLWGHPAHWHIDDEGDEDLGQKAWEDYITKIITLFDKCDAELFDNREMTLYHDYGIRKGYEMSPFEREMFNKEIRELWDERCENAKEALRLMGEEYWNLWD